MNTKKELELLFNELYSAGTEPELDIVLEKYPTIFNNPENWRPLGGNENNFGVIENQQASPIASLIEKITNSIDATLMRKCYEKGIDPKSPTAPKSMDEAVNNFFESSEYWDIASQRRKQAEEIQIVADGPPRESSVIIYDNGEGQNPEDFEDTFLSLLRGNKNEIHFVQGKYNMGGSGAIVFCGKKGYQLVASKKWNSNGEFGFTLVREHPFSLEEQETKKNTWYEYLVIDEVIPSFPIDELDLKLHNRSFKTGTIVKLYSYQFPSGYSGFAQDLNQSINEFMFQPALPILTVDKKERYPNNKVLELDLFGLKRRLEQTENDYVEESFSENYSHERIGKTKVTCYVFKARTKDNSVKKTRENIQKRFFKNNMSVLFSLNGQVHGHYTYEFISRSLKMNLLKNHVLIHVDCTNMNYGFRKELFMASRDRLKHGEETQILRKFLSDKLSKSRLAEIEKKRKNSISVDGGDTKELLKDFSKEIPKDSELFKLLDDTFKLDFSDQSKKKKQDKKESKKRNKEEPFQPERFPSYLKLKAKNDGKTPVAALPKGGEKTLKFETDVENQYFDRVEEPGKFKIGLLNFSSNESEGGDSPGKPKDPEDILNVDVSSPLDGIIKVTMGPKKERKVGEMIQLKVTLDGTGEEFEETFWVKIADPEKPKQKSKKDEDDKVPNIGLPDYVLVYEQENEEDKGGTTWEKLSEQGIEFDFPNVMYPQMSGEKLEKIFINMDSRVLKNYKSKIKNINEEQINTAHKKYITSVYFHTLFLYTITRKRGYRVLQAVQGQEDKPVSLDDYLQDVFDNYYSEFILNFGMEQLMSSLGD
ncbi:MAG: hypothetical protein WD048_00050 [Chitinophagales bacterium]